MTGGEIMCLGDMYHKKKEPEEKRFLICFSGFAIVEAANITEAEKKFDNDNYITKEYTIDSIEKEKG